jgi:hypothetical protein
MERGVVEKVVEWNGASYDGHESFTVGVDLDSMFLAVLVDELGA